MPNIFSYTFSQKTQKKISNASRVAISKDGSKMYAIIEPNSTIEKSTNQGTTWTPTGISGFNIDCINCDDTGQKIICSGNGLGVRYSNNGGTSYTQIEPPGTSAAYFTNSNISGNGALLICSVSNEGTYVSTNEGASWTFNDPGVFNFIWESDINYDGSIIVLANDGSIFSGSYYGIWVSQNFGISYTQKLELSDAQEVRVSSNGKIICSGDPTSGTGPAAGIFISTDAGTTWTHPNPFETSASTYNCRIDWALEGQIIVATPFNGNGTTWISQDYGTSWTAVSNPILGLKPVISENGSVILLQGSVSIYSWSSQGTPLLPQVGIAGLQASKLEGNSGTTELTFTLTKTGVLTADSSVHWTVSNISTANSDFVNGVLQTGTAIFGVGETSKIITISIQGDETVESTETFSVVLSNAVNCILGTSSATGTIQNDDVLLPITLRVSLKKFKLSLTNSSKLKLDDAISRVTNGGFTITFPTFPTSSSNLKIITGSDCVVPWQEIFPALSFGADTIATISNSDYTNIVGGSGKTIWIGKSFESSYEPSILFRKDHGGKGDSTYLDSIRINTISLEVENAHNLGMRKSGPFVDTSIEYNPGKDFSGEWTYYFKEDLRNAKMEFITDSHLDSQITQFIWQGQYHQIADKLGGR